VDAIVTGSACVTVRGKRCGKGAGYSDLEFAILRELGHDPVPVATTVHDVQVVEDFPVDSNDLPLSAIVTSTRHIGIEHPLQAPDRIHWDQLSETDLTAMPILLELKEILEAVS
jgi:5-formyltetrahydrofolate cyclo-ligase